MHVQSAARCHGTVMEVKAGEVVAPRKPKKASATSPKSAPRAATLLGGLSLLALLGCGKPLDDRVLLLQLCSVPPANLGLPQSCDCGGRGRAAI